MFFFSSTPPRSPNELGFSYTNIYTDQGVFVFPPQTLGFSEQVSPSHQKQPVHLGQMDLRAAS